MKIVKWDYEKLKKLKPNYKKLLRIVVEDGQQNLYFAKMDTSSGEVSGKFGLKFDEEIDFDYKNLPNDWSMYLIYNDSLEDAYKKDQEKFNNRLKNTPTTSSQSERKGRRCIKCDGSGYFSEYEHIDKGICFYCNGKGYV